MEGIHQLVCQWDTCFIFRRDYFHCPLAFLLEKSRNMFHWNHLSMCVFLSHGETASSGPGPPHYRGFTVTFCRTPLDEWSNHRRDLYLTTHNSHKIQITMSFAGFETVIPASELPQTHALDCTAMRIWEHNTIIWRISGLHGDGIE
jgi:hypothetical protein